MPGEKKGQEKGRRVDKRGERKGKKEIYQATMKIDNYTDSRYVTRCFGLIFPSKTTTSKHKKSENKQEGEIGGRG